MGQPQDPHSRWPLGNGGLDPVASSKKTRVFVSFDYDHDHDLRKMLLGQAKNASTPFSFEDWSIKHDTKGWKEDAHRRIRRSDVVVVICGHYTDKATGVAAEIKIAREETTAYFLLAGYSDGGNKKPTAALSSDKMYKWTWDNLKSLIAGQR